MLSLAQLDAPFIAEFLDNLESTRSNGARRRNARLASLRSCYQYAALEVPQHASGILRVLAIPYKRLTRRLVNYLTRPEVEAVLAGVDKSTWIGRRNHALLLVALQTGLRLSEITGLRQRDVVLGPGAHVRCEGKGRLQKLIGASDNAILDEYLTNVRRVEEQLQRMEARASAMSDTPAGPVGIPELFDDHMTVTYDILHLAFRGDISRVFTFMLGHEASGRSYAHVGVKEPHHTTSHHKNTPESLDQYARIGSYQMVKLAEFIDKMRNTPDGDGSLLDSSVIYFGAGMSNGLLHDRHNVPAALLGRANGRLEGNRHIQAKKDEPTANLLLALADLAGSEVDSIGHSTGRIEI
jgi:hypothetical protein